MKLVLLEVMNELFDLLNKQLIIFELNSACKIFA
jgi:hypothetical protein